MAKQTVQILVGRGEPKRHSVRMSVIGSPDVKTSGIPDFYVPRTVLDALGAEDSDQIRIEFTVLADREGRDRG